eukprot:1162014-Pelagomonas_calceolata.AAC.17
MKAASVAHNVEHCQDVLRHEPIPRGPAEAGGASQCLHGRIAPALCRPGRLAAQGGIAPEVPHVHQYGCGKRGLEGPECQQVNFIDR